MSKNKEICIGKHEGNVRKKIHETKLPVYIRLGVSQSDLLKNRLWEVYRRKKKN